MIMQKLQDGILSSYEHPVEEVSATLDQYTKIVWEIRTTRKRFSRCMHPPVLQVRSDHREFPAAARRRF